MWKKISTYQEYLPGSLFDKKHQSNRTEGSGLTFTFPLKKETAQEYSSPMLILAYKRLIEEEGRGTWRVCVRHNLHGMLV